MEGEHQSYYNSFYRELSLIDEANNDFRKIERLTPTLAAEAKILDIGCGHGSVSHELVKRGHHVTGIEVNREALASLKNKGIRPIEWDISKPLDIGERFDLVLLLDVLEHVFDPLGLLQQAAGLLNERGSLIVSVPLYFDLLDRLRILFTGRIVSYDNLAYGITNYRKFRSFNYDHIRFFSPNEFWEMCQLAGLNCDVFEYHPLIGIRRLPLGLSRLFSSQWFLNIRPDLFAHSVIARLGTKTTRLPK